mmetsp:Transcript_12351/g.22421  ORF Transcript_12351/g.22421 Transcript_12351/m.22421 type:complete len:214 (-) Transcript_12351:585-1226(-)
MGTLKCQEAGTFQINDTVGNLFQYGRVLPHSLLCPKGISMGIRDTLQQQFQTSCRQSHGTHAMVNPSRSQPRLCHFKALGFPNDQMRGIQLDLFQSNFGMSMGGIIIPKDRQGTHTLDPLALHRHDHHRMCPMSSCCCFQSVMAGMLQFAQHESNFAARIHGPCTPPFTPTQKILAGSSLLDQLCLNIGGITTGYIGFCHEKGGTTGSLQEGF